MITNIKQPYMVQPAFNPILFEFKADANEQFIDYQIRPLSVAVPFYNGKVFFYNGKATINVTPFLQKLFIDQLDGSITNNNTVRLSKLFSIECNILVNAAEYQKDFTVINAVTQIGKSLDYTQNIGFLTEFRELKKYVGFPLDVSILSHKSATIIIIVPASNGNIYINTYYIFNRILTVTVFDDTISVNFSIAGEQTGGTKSVNHVCTPDNPFYVRWLSQRSGWEYFMFSFRQTRKYEISDTSIFKPLILDTSTARGTAKVISTTAAESIIAGAEGLTTADFEVLRKIIYSPMIQFYNEASQTWNDIYIDKAQLEKNNRLSAKDFEVEFILPEPLLQF